MKKILIVAVPIFFLFILIQSQTRNRSDDFPREPQINCADYPAQAKSPYILPFRVGESYRVVTTTGHYSAGNKGVGVYAVDFSMPIGTTVTAARSGVVVAVQEDYEDDNGVDLQENYVFIKHDDDTIGRYFHLTKKGSLVAVGDSVKQGDIIAKSGNSGQSPFPHLHFDVQKCGPNLPPNYNKLPCGQTVPLSFRNTTCHKCGLDNGSTYKATTIDTK